MTFEQPDSVGGCDILDLISKFLPATDLERSKDQRSLANHLLLMTHPIINIQASNPELLHTVNNNQLGGVKLCLAGP